MRQFNMSGYAAPGLDTVRIGIIGLGQRGPHHTRIMSTLEGVEIKALCDVRPEKVDAVKRQLAGTAHSPVLYSRHESEWKKLCERDDVDLVIITTPLYLHAEMAVYAMNHGKHVASEVPIACTIEDCWRLVETSERPRKHCMMLENYCYMEFQLLMLNMARQGVFGQLVHGDCAYIANKMQNNFSQSLYWEMWWLKLYAGNKGNVYPTHGLGPICQMMDINRGDRFDYLVSVESEDFGMAQRARELAACDDSFAPYANKDYRGNMRIPPSFELPKVVPLWSSMIQPRLHPIH